MAAMNLGTITLHRQLARWSEVDPLAAGNQQITGQAMIEIYTRMREYFTSAEGRRVSEAVAGYGERARQPGRRKRDE